jgi:hypothetical protein
MRSFIVRVLALQAKMFFCDPIRRRSLQILSVMIVRGSLCAAAESERVGGQIKIPVL